MAQKKIAFKCVPGSATISERDSRQSIFVVLSGLTHHKLHTQALIRGGVRTPSPRQLRVCVLAVVCPR